MAILNTLKYIEEGKKYGENFSFKLALKIDDKFNEFHRKENFDINLQQESNKMTLLHYACNYGEFDAIKYLLSNGANRQIEDINGETPLFYAIKFGDDINIIKYILEFDENKSEIFKDPLHQILEIKNQLILHKNNENFDALHFAVLNGRINIVKYLLHYEFHHPYEIEILKSLIDLASTKINPQILEAIIEFYKPTEEGQKIIIKFFSNDEHFISSFMNCAKFDNVKCLKILNENVSLSNFKTEIIFKILECATLNGSNNVLNYIENENTREKMDKICRESNYYYKNTLLHISVEKGDIEIFKLFLKYYPNIHLLNRFGNTPLHIAAKEEKIEIFKILFKISSSLITFQNKEKETPLFIICKKNLIPFISFVCKNMNLLSMEIKCFNLFKKEKDDNLEEKCSIFQMCLSLAVETKNMFLLKHLINKSDDFEDREKKEIFQKELKVAIKTKFFDGVEYLLNLDKKQTFFRSEFDAIENHENDETPFMLLIKCMPDIANGVLDTLFSHSDKFRYNELNIFNDMCNKGIEYVNLPEEGKAQDKSRRKNEEENLTITENHPLNLMIKYKRYEMLRHKLIDFYVDAKWNRFARLYHYFALFYQICLITYATFLLFNFVPEPLEPKKETELEICNSKFSFTCWPIFSSSKFYGSILCVLQIVAIIFRNYQFVFGKCNFGSFNCCAGIFQCFSIFGSFIKNIFSSFFSAIIYSFKYEFLNFVTFILLGIVIIFRFSLHLQFIIILILNLLVWLSLFNHLEQHPRLGVYVVMIVSILKSFGRFVPILIVILLPFVLKFFVILKKNDNTSFFEMFVQTLAMMFGDINFKDRFGNSDESTNTKIVVKQILFILFLLIAIIFLNNLVLGLAVDNVSKVLEDAFIKRRILQIQSIHHIENAMPYRVKRFFWHNYCKVHKNYIANLKPDGCCSSLKRIKWLTDYFGLPKNFMAKEPAVENEIKEIKAKLNSLEILMGKILQKLEEQN